MTSRILIDILGILLSAEEEEYIELGKEIVSNISISLLLFETLGVIWIILDASYTEVYWNRILRFFERWIWIEFYWSWCSERWELLPKASPELQAGRCCAWERRSSQLLKLSLCKPQSSPGENIYSHSWKTHNIVSSVNNWTRNTVSSCDMQNQRCCGCFNVCVCVCDALF